MSVAGRALVASTVAAVSPGFVLRGPGAVHRLEDHVGMTRLFEVADDPLGSSDMVPMTLCTSTLWAEDWLVRVRYELGGPAHVDVDAEIARDCRAIIAAIRAATYAPTLDLLLAGHAPRRIETLTGGDGLDLAKIAEIPVRVRFYE